MNALRHPLSCPGNIAGVPARVLRIPGTLAFLGRSR
jgi:hypothetical protein